MSDIGCVYVVELYVIPPYFPYFYIMCLYYFIVNTHLKKKQNTWNLLGIFKLLWTIQFFVDK